jgi:hypothetical protein
MRVLSTALLLSAVVAAIARASKFAPPVTPRVAGLCGGESAIQFSNTSRPQLQLLWQQSIAANQERVACMGGHRSGDTTYITSLQQIPESADSMHASATASLRRCGPPQWLGTVHTHIARQNGVPYVTFSGADRGVMGEWNRLWGTDGVFCVLYDEQHAYCEAGERSSGTPVYAAPRGNNLVH